MKGKEIANPKRIIHKNSSQKQLSSSGDIASMFIYDQFLEFLPPRIGRNDETVGTISTFGNISMKSKKSFNNNLRISNKSHLAKNSSVSSGR